MQCLKSDVKAYPADGTPGGGLLLRTASGGDGSLVQMASTHLGGFLLDRAARSDTVAHRFFWTIRAEMWQEKTSSQFSSLLAELTSR